MNQGDRAAKPTESDSSLYPMPNGLATGFEDNTTTAVPLRRTSYPLNGSSSVYGQAYPQSYLLGDLLESPGPCLRSATAWTPFAGIWQPSALETAPTACFASTGGISGPGTVCSPVVDQGGIISHDIPDSGSETIYPQNYVHGHIPMELPSYPMGGMKWAPDDLSLNAMAGFSVHNGAPLMNDMQATALSHLNGLPFGGQDYGMSSWMYGDVAEVTPAVGHPPGTGVQPLIR